MKEKNKKSMIFMALGVLLVAIAIVAGVSIAYFTSKPQAKTISFNKGNVSITTNLSDIGVTVKGGSVVSENVTITNNGNVDAYVYLIVENPIATVKVFGDDGLITGPASSMELFSYSVLDGWELIKTINGNDKNTYVYAYTTGVVTSGSTTTSLISSYKLVNFTEGQVDDVSLLFTGVGIQSDSIELQGDTLKDKLLYAYENYLSSGEGN